jgi:pimeloyl-ACP methyl ester carboxylesterase
MAFVSQGVAVVAGMTLLVQAAGAAQCANFYVDKCQAPLSTGVTMSYVEQGPRGGTPVIFLHGYTDSSLEFVATAAALKKRDPTLRLIALDQRGAGSTGLPDTETCRTTPARCVTNADHVADVVAFMEAMKIEKAVLVGHSMGSVVARAVALAHPEYAAKLVLIGTPGPEPGGTIGAAGLTGLPKDSVGGSGPLEVHAWQKTLAARGLAWPQGAFNIRLIDFDPNAVADLTTYWNISKVAPEAFALALSAQTALVPLKYWDIDPTPVTAPPERLDTLAVPTLVLWGTQDGIMKKPSQDKLLATLREAARRNKAMSFTWKQYGVRPLTVSGQQSDDLGHEIVWEAPDELAADLDSFITTGQPTGDLYHTDAPANLHRIVTEPGKAILVRN